MEPTIKKQDSSGMAIALVLGFVFVAMIMGSTLIFVSRARIADSQRIYGRLQHFHVAHSGISAMLSRVKTKTFQEVKEEYGRKFDFQLPRTSFGNAEAWCEVSIEQAGDNTFKVVSRGFWDEPEIGVRMHGLTFDIEYDEQIVPFGRNRRQIRGEWKIIRFSRLSGN